MQYENKWWGKILIDLLVQWTVFFFAKCMKNKYRLAFFVARVATDSAVFVATIPVSQILGCLCYSILELELAHA